MPTTPEEPEQPTDPPGGVLVGGRYRLMQRIGSGGMGVVWSARDEILRRRVAVKELHHTPGSSERSVAEGRERSLREARAAAALHHPHIVAVYDIVEHGGRPWIVMEFVSGRSLKEVVSEDGPLPTDRAVDIGLKLLAALQAAHAAGITHRDVKPANVLIAEDDGVRLTDFGLATMQDAETLTDAGVVLGTPGYLAPEQARGLAPGPPADVFGLGATLYFAIEGVGPFHRDGYLPMLVAYTRHEIRPPERAGALGPVLLALLVADPAKRPTAEQARRMLLDGPVRRTVLSRRLLLTGGAAAAVVGAAAGARFWFDVPIGSPTPAGPTRPVPPSPAARRIGLGARAWHRDDLRQPVAMGSVLLGWHPDGVLAVDAATGRERWRWRTAGDWSVAPVTAALAFVSGPTGGQVLDVHTGAVRSRPVDQADSSGGVAGLVLAVSADPPSTLVGYDPATARRRWRVRGEGYFGSEYFSAAGDVVCAGFDQGGGVSLVYGIHRETGAVRWKAAMTTDGIVKGHWGHGTQVYVNTIQRGRWALAALDARTGNRRWVLPVAEAEDRGPHDTPISVAGVVGIGGLVVATVRDTRMTLRQAGLIAVDAATGAVRWRRPLLNPSVAAVSGQRLFVGAADSVLHELDPRTGATRWSTSTAGPVDALTVGSTMLVAAIGHGATAYPLLPG